MKMNWILVGASSGFVAVALGAFGAHALGERLSPEALDWWRTGVFYQLTHAPVIALLGVLQPSGRRVGRAGWTLSLGSLIFSGTLYLMALGLPRWLGAITPVGGTLLLAGWVLLALASRERPLDAQ